MPIEYWRVQDVDVPVQAERAGEPVDRPQVLEQVHPRVGAHDEARPERHDHGDQQQSLRLGGWRLMK